VLMVVRGGALERARALDLGADDVISAPFETLEFAAKVRTQFRLTMANALNHPNFAVPRSNISSRGTVGTIASQVRVLNGSPSPREIDLGLRVDGGMVTIEVADRGPGFPPDFLPRAFERFSRPDTSPTRDRGGAGLGLAIVKAITEAHGGRVEAGNRPDGGAVVRVELPADG